MNEPGKRVELTETKTVKKQTWIGLTGSVTIGPDFMHKAGLEGFEVPHPPVFNWLLRKGLPENARYALTLTHEFGHLQTAPLILLYTGVMIAIHVGSGRASVPGIILVLIGSHAFWEIITELYTVTRDSRFYRESYGTVTRIPRIIFWIVTSALTISGWFGPV